MIISFLKINPPLRKRKEALDLLQYVKGPLLVAPGCLDCSVYEDTTDNSILFIEQWRSREELDEHIKSGSYMGVLTAMELSSIPPEIRFVESLETDGMKLINALRTI